jgi:hypothetical protein
MQMSECIARYKCKLLVPDLAKPGTIKLHFNIIFSLAIGVGLTRLIDLSRLDL